MNKTKAEEMVARLLANAAGLQFGAVSVCIKVYNGQVAQVMYSTTENKKVDVSQADDEK